MSRSARKNNSFAASGKSVAPLRLSHPAKGRIAIVTRRAVGCDGRCGVRRIRSLGENVSQRTAKSCGPGAATVASIHAGPCWRGNGDNQRRSPGRARISRQPIAWGKPGCLGCTCSVCPCASRMGRPCAPVHGIYGRSQRPAFPAPSVRERDNELVQLGQKRAAGMLSTV